MSGPRPGGLGPLARVVAALEAGATSRVDVARHTGLSSDTVDAVVEHLVRTGRVSAQRLGAGCPEVGCGGCLSEPSQGAAACGASPAGSRGLVVLTLRVAR